jgi:hypothetical protein
MSAWLDTVKKQHEEGKKTNPDYTYKQAMIDASAKKNGHKAPKSKKSSKGSKKSKKCCPCPQKGGTDTDAANAAINEDVVGYVGDETKRNEKIGGKRRLRKSPKNVTKRGGKSRRRKGGKKTRKAGKGKKPRK